MTVITRRTLGQEKLQQEREILLIRKLSESKNQHDLEISRNSSQVEKMSHNGAPLRQRLQVVRPSSK